MSGTTHERIDTVVIGAGQAGPATGYHLARRGRAGAARVALPRSRTMGRMSGALP